MTVRGVVSCLEREKKSFNSFYSFCILQILHAVNSHATTQIPFESLCMVEISSHFLVATR